MLPLLFPEANLNDSADWRCLNNKATSVDLSLFKVTAIKFQMKMTFSVDK